MAEELHYSAADGVARLVVDRPAAQNMLSPELMERLAGIVDELSRDESVQAVVVTGAGTEFFSTGLLNPGLKVAMGKERVVEFVMRANRIFDALEALPQVVLCGVNGRVRAGAVELMLACDIRFAAAHATLSLPEAKWGGFPGAGGPVRLPMLVGHGRALELICTGREIDAAEMEHIGLVERVIPSADFAAVLDQTARTIAGNGPLAIRGAKRIMRLRREPGFQAARELSDTLRRAFEWTWDSDEGGAAHKEGRAPKFRGR